MKYAGDPNMVPGTFKSGDDRDDSRLGVEPPSRNHHYYREPNRIAPYSGGPIPPEETFVAVPVFDISRSGFSFYADRVPGSPFLIVAMNVADQVVYVTARVVHHRSNPELGGKPYIVGCQLTGRVYEESEWGDGSEWDDE